jgi:anti-sigma regulatory factor (Ser/Thr protein kinase)
MTRFPRTGVAAVASGAATLTVLFTMQDVMRRGMTGGGGGTAQSLVVNGADWVLWALLAPIIFRIGAPFRLDDADHRWRNAAVWIALGVVCCTMHSAASGILLRSLHALPTGAAGAARLPLGRFLVSWTAATVGFNVIIFLMIVGLLHAAMYYEDLKIRRARESGLESRLARAELNVLRMQLHPHFLFNTLHTVSSLMVNDVPTAQRVITALGALLRTSIDHTARQEIPLHAELGFLRQYLDIQRARFRQRLAVDIDVGPELQDALVPSLFLQPLVENAIRHAVEPRPAGGRVSVRASREGERLTIAVRDDGGADPLPVSTMLTPAGGGVGLANTEARLAQLYGARHEFRAAQRTGGGFEVVMSFPFRAAVHGPSEAGVLATA